MKLKHAREIVKLLEERGAEATLHRDYSGRGMFGEKTSAVSGDMAEIGWASGKLGHEKPAWRQDNMGYGAVVY